MMVDDGLSDLATKDMVDLFVVFVLADRSWSHNFRWTAARIHVVTFVGGAALSMCAMM